jgi:hypothetical protein
LAARGMPVRGIAVALDLSPNTVKSHLHHAAEKLGAANRGETLQFAATAGLITINRQPLALVAEVLRLAAAAGLLPERRRAG